MTPADAYPLLLTGQTVYMVDTGTGPRLTTRIPCGRTNSYSLGRYPPDAMPTETELQADITHGLAQLARNRSKAA